MAKTTSILTLVVIISLIVLLVSAFFLSGCLSDNQRPPGRQGFRGGPEISEEERQQMMEEMHNYSIQACEGKEENETCMIESPRGEMNATCVLEEDELLCRPSRNFTRPRGEPGFRPPPNDQSQES